MATYLHAIDGRLRVRLSTLQGDRRAAAQLRRELRALSGVTDVEANPLTGSVLVNYDSEALSEDDILGALDVEASEVEGARTAFAPSESASDGPKVRDVVAEKMIEFAAERLLLAVLA
jgi:copper chaperone CopZ